MKSKTKADLKTSDIEKMLISLYPCKQALKTITELTDGCFNTSFRADYGEGKSMIIKTGPPEGIDLLAYEDNMMSTELEIHHLIQDLGDVPVPRILHIDQTRNHFPYEFFIMEALEGKPLNKIENLSNEDRKKIYIPLARYMARIHSLKGDHFGYAIWKQELTGKSYFDAYLHMVKKILEDGKIVDAYIPISEDEIFNMLNTYINDFNDFTHPVLVHFDLWDGNLFIQRNGERLELEAIIDFERGFFGDPAADFSQVAPFIDLKKDSWFLEEYNKIADVPAYADKALLNRIQLFRFYLFLIMIVESYYRDVDGSFEGQKKWSEEELVKLYRVLT